MKNFLPKLKKQRFQNRSKKSGFSLIELSIVLVILGLLIAGVSGGASLIKSAELRAATAEYKNFTTAMGAFQTQFDGLPGDYNGGAVPLTSAAPGAAGNFSTGNAYTRPTTATLAPTYVNGVITVVGTGTGFWPNQNSLIEHLNLESLVFWGDLKNVGLDFAPNNALYNTGPLVVPVVGTTTPASKIKNSGWYIDAFSSLGSLIVGTAPQGNIVYPGNNFILASTLTVAPSIANSFLTGTAPFGGILTGTDAETIDNKIDDGLPGTGRVKAALRGSPGNHITSAGVTTANVAGANCASLAGGPVVGNFTAAYTTNAYTRNVNERACALVLSAEL